MIKWASFLVLILTASISMSAEKQGGLVLQFDDGWSSWRTTIAPEVQKVGGVATCFVNNQNIKSGRITLEDLLTLQNTYQWEIGTHTWHHMDSPSYVKKNGLNQWESQELMKSITELRGLGLNIRSLVFPFNSFSPELVKLVQPLVESYRRSEILALADGISSNKSVPGTAIDMAHYVPTELLKEWIDIAAQQNTLLFIYGHRILPDSNFVTGKVVSATETTLTCESPVILPSGTDLALVPDVTRRQVTSDFFKILKVEGNVITVDRSNLSLATHPGATFMIGESYSTRLSNFRTMLEYASPRLNFYTLHDVAAGKWKK